MNELDLYGPRLHALLLGIDRDLAAQARRKGCPYCGGVLHSAQYPRKARGRPPSLPAQEIVSRFSFCCHTCRRRTTPTSVRFLGRRVYSAPLMLILSTIRGSVSGSQASQLRKTFGVARRTLERWRRWWLDIFVLTPFWNATRARFMPPVMQSELPASLLERFQAVDIKARLVQCLRFLCPLTASAITQIDDR
jgi:hypothetical protein